MLNRKGVTLIELIIAIAIIGIIAVGILSGFSSGFSMITMGRESTADTFNTQQEIERAMEDMKQDIDEGTAPSPGTQTLFSGTLSRDVNYYPIHKQLSGGIDVSVYVTGRLPQFPLYEVDDVNIEFFDGTNALIPYSYIDRPSLMVRQANEPVISDPNTVRAAEVYRWYVSRSGFNIPFYDDTDPEEIYIGSIWPGMNDFNEIKTGLTTPFKQLSSSEVLADFAGKHIIHTVTPGTVHGRTGVEVVSNHLYIPGLPYSQNLKLHLDASLINQNEPSEVPSYENVEKWNDLSTPSYDAIRDSSEPFPQLGLTEKNNSYWQLLTGNGSEMSIGSFSSNVSEMTVFFVAKFENTENDHRMIGNDRWGLGWDTEGDLEFYVEHETDSEVYSAKNPSTIDPDEWYVLTGIIDSDGVKLRMAGADFEGDNTGFSSPNFEIGPMSLEWFDGLNIAEIIIYDTALTETNRHQVEQYLNEKYDPPVQSISIDFLFNVSRTVKVGESFSMPPVTARMTSGANQSVPVSWSPGIIDTSSPGVYTSTGTAIADPSKNMTLTVNVQPVQTYTVTFVDHDGTVLKTEAVTEEESASPPDVPERTGYNFTGWSPGYSYITSDLTVEAQYDPIYYDVTFSVEGTEYDVQSIAHGQAATIPAEPVRTGYSFNGWDGDLTNITTNVTLTALWSANQYTVTFSSNDGRNPNPTSKVVTFNEPYGALASVTRQNFDFDGWYTEAGGGTEITSSTIVSTALDHMLYAQWSASGASCPFIYSYDGSDYHIEHESIPFAINKALETTSFSALKHLKEVDGEYHIRIAEELEEKSFINAFELSIIDYPKNSGVIEVMPDIFGNAHTINEKIAPVKFISSDGKDRRSDVIEAGKFVTSSVKSDSSEGYVTGYEATFDLPQDYKDTGKLMVVAQKTNLTTQLGDFYLDEINAAENMWWIEKILASPLYHDKFKEFMRVINLHVDVWDGEEWIYQGEIKAGLHVLEEYLVPIDLSLLDNLQEEVKVRLRSGAGLFEIDKISIDFSENQIVEEKILQPNTARFNDESDVLENLGNFDDGKHVRMTTGDDIFLRYDVPDKKEENERGFIIGLKGYYYMDPNTQENLFDFNTDQEKPFGSITKMLRRTILDDTVEALRSLRWLQGIIDAVYNESFEEKVKVIVYDNFLDNSGNHRSD